LGREGLPLTSSARNDEDVQYETVSGERTFNAIPRSFGGDLDELSNNGQILLDGSLCFLVL
jgi:hypothetical protein